MRKSFPQYLRKSQVFSRTHDIDQKDMRIVYLVIKPKPQVVFYVYHISGMGGGLHFSPKKPYTKLLTLKP